MLYIVKMEGMKVRTFNTFEDALTWGKNHCKFVHWSIVRYVECNGLPRANKPIHPNLDMPDLRYKPFVGV